MKQYKKYQQTAVQIFELFLSGNIDRKKLISELHLQIELQIDKRASNKPFTKLWFKFFEGDTGVTTLTDLYNDVESVKNALYTRDLMHTACDNPDGLQIFYS